MFGRREFLAGGVTLGVAQTASAGAPQGGARDAAIDGFVKSQGFQGVVLIGKAGKPVFSRAVGLADIQARRPTTLDTPYAIASISKWLTAIAVMRLELDLDAPITRYLPDYRADTGAKVTLRRLMTNTSGVPNGFSLAAKTDPDILKKTISTAEAVRQWCSGDLAFEPGTKFDYALTNWILITAIVEAAAGKPFAEVMSEQVIVPLGLTHTKPIDPPGMAVSYRTVEPLVPQSNLRLACMAAGGGYVSTAADLLKAAHQVFDKGFLPPAQSRELMTVGWPDESYALGGRVKTLFVDGMPRVCAWETGRAAGYRSVLAHRFDDQTTVVLLNNTSITQKAMDELAYSLFGAI